MTSTAPRRGSSAAGIAGEPRPRRQLPNTWLRNVLYLAKLVVAAPFFPFWPIFLAAVSRDAYYVNHYFETLWHCVRTLRNAFRNRSWGRIFKYNLMVPRAIEAQLGSQSWVESRGSSAFLRVGLGGTYSLEKAWLGFIDHVFVGYGLVLVSANTTHDLRAGVGLSF